MPPSRHSVKRRGRGEGSIFQRSDGKWVAEISLGIVNGRRRARKMIAATKREAQVNLEGLRGKHTAGTLLLTSCTVSALLSRWDHDVLIPTVEAHTRETYLTLAGSHIAPHLGAMPVLNLTPEVIASWLSKLATLKVGAPSRRRAFGILRQILGYGIVLGVLNADPTLGIKPPRIYKKPRMTLTPDQIREYFTQVGSHRLGPIITLAIVTTMREGELLGLQWSDIDWDSQAIYAQHTLKRANNRYYLGIISKSDSSRRRIDLPRFALDVLRDHRERMGKEGHGSSFVFCQSNGKPINPSNLRNRFHFPALRAAGLPRITFHDLRHTAATMLFGLGVHPKVAQERLGHSTIQMTMDLYSHAIPSMQKDAANLIEALFRRETIRETDGDTTVRSDEGNTL